MKWGDELLNCSYLCSTNPISLADSLTPWPLNRPVSMALATIVTIIRNRFVFISLPISLFVNRAVLLVISRFQHPTNYCQLFSAPSLARFALRLSNLKSLEDAYFNGPGDLSFIRFRESRQDSHTLCQEVFL